MTNPHENFELRACGFIINPYFPHIGASLDGKVSRSCCDTQYVEIKCPYCAKDSSLADFVQNKRKQFCLREEHGKLSLQSEHMYMYHIQTQLLVGNVDFVDFVVWTKDMHMKQMGRDQCIVDEI